LLNDPVKLKSLLENIPLKHLGKPEDVAPVAAFFGRRLRDGNNLLR
jgi:hypothetical protein